VHKPQRMVDVFHDVFRLPRPEQPTWDEFGEVRVSLIIEEAAEVAKAVEANDMIETIKELCDLLYVTYGAAVALGVDLDPFFQAVHENNMSKVSSDGTVHYREDGKVLKPEEYQPLDLRTLFESMYVHDEGKSNG